MPLRTKIFIVISVVVLIILGVTVGLLIRSKKPAASTPPTQNNTQTTGSTDTGVDSITQQMTGLTVKPLTPEETVQAGVKQYAKIFIERYYTYSSDSNFQNIRDVQTLVTASLWKQMAPRLNGTRSAGDDFVGVTTRVYGTSVESWGASTANIRVLTQQSAEKNGVTTSKNQNYIVTVVKQGTQWLVDSVTTAS